VGESIEEKPVLAVGSGKNRLTWSDTFQEVLVPHAESGVG
jgi:hypothetical protein